MNPNFTLFTPQLHEERIQSLKESQWQGRAGTLDHHNEGPGSFEKESVRLRNKGGRSGALPPLDPDGRVPSRGHSAPAADGGFGDIGEEAENKVKHALSKARSLGDKNKKFSTTEKNLLDSPFAQPVLKQITDGSNKGGSPGH